MFISTYFFERFIAISYIFIKVAIRGKSETLY